MIGIGGQEFPAPFFALGHTPCMHQKFIRRCLELATTGRGKTGINPLVGAVLVREGKVVAEGCYEGFGKPHAERQLLEKFVQKISSKDILYVNLEPCSHQGMTPPCTNYLINKGIKKVVYGMQDPDSRVAGKGIAALRKGDVEVIGPVLRTECEWLNKGFISLRTKGRPWITLKRAQTLSGKTSAKGSRLRITSAEQDAWAHENLRNESDAILVGVETVIRDEPLLTTRNPNKKSEQNYRIILDPTLRIPQSANVVSDSYKEKTIIVTEISKLKTKEAEELLGRGVQVIGVETRKGKFVWEDLWKALTTPSESFHGISSILVEGGARTWEEFKKAGVVDEEIMLVGNE